MFFIDADVDFPTKSHIEEVQILKITKKDPFQIFKNFSPETYDYITVSCDDGWIVIGIPRDPKVPRRKLK